MTTDRGEPLGESAGKLGPAPAHGTAVGDLRAYLTRAFGLPQGYEARRVVRHGGRSGTALHVHIRAPGGKELVIAYEEERLCRSADSLRAQAAADTDGLTRGELLTNRAAASVFEALCSLADVYEHMDVTAQAWEWVQELRARAARLDHSLATTNTAQRYEGLRALRDYRYSKAALDHPPYTGAGIVLAVVPPLVVDNVRAGAEWVTARHLYVFVRYDLGDDAKQGAIFSRVLEAGGERRTLQAWNARRTDKLRLTVFRLPQDEPPTAANEEES